jgi:RNA recognition motif-containing protein
MASSDEHNNTNSPSQTPLGPSTYSHQPPFFENNTASDKQEILNEGVPMLPPHDPMIITSSESEPKDNTLTYTTLTPTTSSPSPPANTAVPPANNYTGSSESNTTEHTHNNNNNSSSSSGSTADYPSRLELENFYKDVGSLRASRGAIRELTTMRDLSMSDPLSPLNPLRRMVYHQDESITYNVYVGGLGEEVDENDLFHYFSPCGPIDSCRVFRSKDEPFHKFAHPSLCPDVGYGFVHFITPEGQQKALSKEFNRPKIKNSCGYTKIAVEKTTLFVGGLPISMKESEVSEMFRNAYINFRSLILKTGPPPNCTSRGFCFLSFDTHKAAEAARQILLSGPVHGKMLTVGWAEPQVNIPFDFS